MVGDIERNERRLLGDAGIAGRAVEPLDERARCDLPGKRMLASARAEEEDVHTWWPSTAPCRRNSTQPEALWITGLSRSRRPFARRPPSYRHEWCLGSNWPMLSLR